jgi:hypothetical protein
MCAVSGERIMLLYIPHTSFEYHIFASVSAGIFHHHIIITGYTRHHNVMTTEDETPLITMSDVYCSLFIMSLQAIVYLCICIILDTHKVAIQTILKSLYNSARVDLELHIASIRRNMGTVGYRRVTGTGIDEWTGLEVSEIRPGTSSSNRDIGDVTSAGEL